MSAFAAIAVKSLGAAAAAALLSAGAVNAATPSPSPGASPDRHAARAAVVKAVVESEADVLGMKPEDLRRDLKQGHKVSDLAKAKGIAEEQFATRLAAALKPSLETLVDHETITQARADRLLDRIAKGHVPFWDGVRHRKK